MSTTILKKNDITYLEEMLADGPVPYDAIKDVKQNDIMLYCLKRGIYQILTTELVDWISGFMTNPTIEIGSGSNDLYKYLDIPGTDNYCQQLPEVKSYYALLGQTPTNPSEDVEKLDAVEALARYNPQTVIASWMTQLAQPDIKPGQPGSVYSPLEEEILNVSDYILIGNINVHGDKRIMEYEHETFEFPWLVSRSPKKEDNRIWVWNKQDVTFPEWYERKEIEVSV